MLAFPTRVAVDEPEVVNAINGLADEVTAELARLRQMLEALHEASDGNLLDRALTDEWSIAVDGLFGPSGVLGFVAGAMKRPSGERGAPRASHTRFRTNVA